MIRLSECNCHEIFISGEDPEGSKVKDVRQEMLTRSPFSRQMDASSDKGPRVGITGEPEMRTFGGISL